jgi:hypothetical protein
VKKPDETSNKFVRVAIEEDEDEEEEEEETKSKIEDK